jgi:hypothetical protein
MLACCIHPILLSTLQFACDSRNTVIVRKNKTNASSSAGSVYLFVTAFLQLHSEDGRRYPLSAIRWPKTSLDRRVVLRPFPHGRDGQGPGLVDRFLVGMNRKHRLQARIDRYLCHITQSNVRSNRHMCRMSCGTRFRLHQRLFLFWNSLHTH